MTRLLLSVLLALTAACDTPPEDDGDAAPLDAGQVDGGDRGPDAAPPVDASPPDAASVDADGAPPDADAPPPDAAPPAVDAAPPSVDAGPPPGPRIGGLWDAYRTPWPMFGLDPQRTGRSPFLGPRTLTAGAAGNWRVRAEGQAVINLQPAVDAVGVYFGGWGVQRLAEGAPLTDRIKSDGRYFGLDAASGEALFEPFDPAPVHGCYVHPGRAQVPRDATWCGEGEHVVSFYNGTIEATPLIDPDNGRHYVGRGDGRLYAIDPVTGAVLWAFATFNPEDPDDPDGGGEIVGGAVMGPDRLIYFATAGLPAADPPLNPRYETNAVYAIDRRGHLVWRYPGRRASLERGFLAAPALDPAGETVYFGTWAFGDGPGELLAFDLRGDGTPRWTWTLDNPARAGTPAWVRHLTVGGDGTLYVGAAEARGLNTGATVFALRDEGEAPGFAWPPVSLPPERGQWAFTAGLALQEAPDPMLVATVGFQRAGGLPPGDGGGLYALDPATGALLASFNPSLLPTPGVGGFTAPTLDAEGVIYAGVHGRHDALLAPPGGQWLDGFMYALRRVGDGFEVLGALRVDGQLDWAHPALGADGGLYFGSSDRFPGIRQTQTFPPGPVELANPWFYGIFQ